MTNLVTRGWRGAAIAALGVLKTFFQVSEISSKIFSVLEGAAELAADRLKVRIYVTILIFLSWMRPLALKPKLMWSKKMAVPAAKDLAANRAAIRKRAPSVTAAAK